MNIKNLQDFKKISFQIRKGILESTYCAQSGHVSSSLSCVEIINALYFNIMNISPTNPIEPNRDRFILSKGHAAPALYSALALRGFFPYENLKSLRQIDSILQGHPDMRKIPGIDSSSGSLGQGLSIGIGMSLAAKLDKKNYNVYVLLGDGELEEGQVWEAMMYAKHYKLNNLILFVDNNNLQLDGNLEEILSPYPLNDKFKSFGWDTLLIDGHNISEIINSVNYAKQNFINPTAIICKTIKGKGVSFIENQKNWHGKVLNEQQFKLAISEIEEVYNNE